MAIHDHLLLLVVLFSWTSSPVLAQYASSFPSPMSMITKTAYLNSWTQINSSVPTAGNTPFFWGRQDLGWMTAIRVDGTSYVLTASQNNFQLAQGLAAAITPTRSVFTMQAGSVNLNLTYISPIEPSDWVLQSLPFGYLAIDIWSADDKPHSVQLYSDISGQWISGNQGNVMTWSTTTTAKSIYHQAARQQKAAMGEIQGFAEDSTVYLAVPLSTPFVTHQTASFNVSRSIFAENGKLDNTANTTYRAIGKDYPVLAFAADLGNIEKTSSPIVFALGLVRDPVVTYRKNGALENRPPLFRTRWKTETAAIDDFLANFSNALSRAIDFDTKIMSDAGKVSGNYSDLVAASLRQTMAPLEFTTAPNGDFDGDLRVFLKDLGTTDRINPVDTLYAAFPAYLYLNTSLAGHLLEPLLEFQSSSGYTNAYAAPDLGTWPNALGNTTDQKAFAVENCGSMLIMALAHAQKSGDGTLIQKYYKLLKGWADYLVTNTLVPTGYLSADNTSSTTSNLALKGITGIWAMSKINEALGSTGTQNNLTQSYLATAKDYAKQWQTRAFLGDHIASDYGSSTNWGLIYNLYAPKLLNSDLIPENIFDTQASWYRSQLPKGLFDAIYLLILRTH
ncbi:hypothetical protein CPB83DRAFT_371296 [Crepidotus variabilis]|uniref:Glutaminase A n=1 Tax=Crepidotus variabilis TaxID=179855 RepID=A0A9P6JNY8_9AGAR|nr:hypothetical protein CPB83DRAFT_371296 [Crepidotus variabilis]